MLFDDWQHVYFYSDLILNMTLMSDEYTNQWWKFFFHRLKEIKNWNLNVKIVRKFMQTQFLNHIMIYSKSHYIVLIIISKHAKNTK